MADENKYMIILTDGGARMWYDGTHAKAPAYSSSGIIYWNNIDDWNARYKNTPFPTFADVWNAGEEEINKYSMTYMEKSQASPDDVPSWNDVITKADYHTGFEAGTYNAAKEILKAAEEFNMIMVTYGYNEAENFDDSPSYAKYAESFKSWLAEHNNVTRYDTRKEDPADIFSNIEDRLISLVDKGSKVVDEIGEGFVFKNEENLIKLTVAGEEYAKVKLTDTSYEFRDPEGHSAFTLTYYPDGTEVEFKDVTTKYGECFVLDINQAIIYDYPVQLIYSVHLENPETTAGEYGKYDKNGSGSSTELLTNKVATLFPVDSKEVKGTPEDFPLPKVSYKIIDISGTKTWDDNDDQDGKRPDSITVELYKNEEKIDEVVVKEDEEGNWKYEFTGLRLLWIDAEEEGKEGKFEDESVYSISEVLPEDSEYTSEVNGFDIINTYKPETVDINVTKVWNDNNNRHGLRPENVTVVLYADGEVVSRTVLSDAEQWTAVFEGMPKCADGEEITYIVDETDVPAGYTKSITADGNSFTVTNTYKDREKPDTGDHSNAAGYLYGMIGCATVAMYCALRARKQNVLGH